MDKLYFIDLILEYLTKNYRIISVLTATLHEDLHELLLASREKINKCLSEQEMSGATTVVENETHILHCHTFS
jgi:hypothetical protein